MAAWGLQGIAAHEDMGRPGYEARYYQLIVLLWHLNSLVLSGQRLTTNQTLHCEN